MIYSNMNIKKFVKASEHEDKDPKKWIREGWRSSSANPKHAQCAGDRERATWLRRLTQPLVGEATTTEEAAGIT